MIHYGYILRNSNFYPEPRFTSSSNPNAWDISLNLDKLFPSLKAALANKVKDDKILFAILIR